VHYHDRLDLMLRIRGERFGDPFDRRGLAPLGLEILDRKSVV